MLYVVAHCDAVPTLDNATSGEQTRVGTTAVYRCDEGYRFANNVTQANTTCLEGNVWTVDVRRDVQCERKSMLVNLKADNPIAYRTIQCRTVY